MHLSRRASWDVRSSLAASFLIVIAQIIPAVALAANRPPTISGTPITSIKAGDYYLFPAQSIGSGGQDTPFFNRQQARMGTL